MVVRLLGPAAAGMFERESSPFFQETRIHRVNNKSIHCLKKFDKASKRYVGDCPICSYYHWLWRESEKPGVGMEEAAKLQARARAIKPNERYYYNCIVRKTEDGQENAGPLILSVGEKLHKRIVLGITGSAKLEEKGYGDVTDRVSGRDLKIVKTLTKSGREVYPNYDSSKYLEESPAGNPEEFKIWMQSLHDLVALRILKDPEYLKIELKKHLGLIPADSSDNFDPSEYGYSSQEPTVHVEANQETHKKNESFEEAVSSGGNGEAMDSDDFFNNLRKLD